MTHVCPCSLPLLITCSPPPQKHCSVGDTWLFVKGRPCLSPTRTLCQMERSAAVCSSPLLNFVAVRLECQGHPQLESHSDIWRPGHGSLSPPLGSRSRVEWGAAFCVSPCSILFCRPTSMSAKVHGGAPPIRVSPSSLALLLEFFSFYFSHAP